MKCCCKSLERSIFIFIRPTYAAPSEGRYIDRIQKSEKKTRVLEVFENANLSMNTKVLIIPGYFIYVFVYS